MMGNITYNFEYKGLKLDLDLGDDIESKLWSNFELHCIIKKIDRLGCNDLSKLKIMCEYIYNTMPLFILKRIINNLDQFDYYPIGRSAPNNGTEWMYTKYGAIDSDFICIVEG